jgi:hypothetical protein
VSLKDNLVVTFKNDIPATSRRVSTEDVQALKETIEAMWEKLSGISEKISEYQEYLSVAIDVMSNYIDDIAKKQSNIIKLINKTRGMGTLTPREAAEFNKVRYDRLNALAKKSTLACKTRNALSYLKFGDAIGCVGGFISLVNNLREMVQNCQTIVDFYFSIPNPCERSVQGHSTEARCLQSGMVGRWLQHEEDYCRHNRHHRSYCQSGGLHHDCGCT